MNVVMAAVNFVFGYRPGTESERIYRQWYREGYHTPKDDPDHINYGKLTRMAQWMSATGWLVANAPERVKVLPK